MQTQTKLATQMQKECNKKQNNTNTFKTLQMQQMQKNANESFISSYIIS